MNTSIPVRAPRFTFHVQCHDADGNFVWEDDAPNTVMDAGINSLLDEYFAGSSYTAAWYCMLVDNASFTAYAAADTMSSHAGWLENTNYDEATRQAFTFAAAASKSKATSSPSVVTMNASVTIRGFAATTNSTKGGTTGTLYCAADFTGGSKAVGIGYTLSISATMTGA